MKFKFLVIRNFLYKNKIFRIGQELKFEDFEYACLHIYSVKGYVIIKKFINNEWRRATLLDYKINNLKEQKENKKNKKIKEEKIEKDIRKKPEGK